MDKTALRIFQQEVERQCRFSLIAIQDLDQALQHDDMDRFWYSVQSFLVAAGNISKLLWPPPKPKRPLPERGAELRASLLVSGDSPLEPRTFRNHFEHFDRRLETWAMSSKRHGFVDSNIGPTGMIAGPEPEDVLRNFDTTLCAVTFCGEVCHLRPIADAVRELWKKASVESKKLP